MKIKGERLYNTSELMEIIDMCTEIEELEFVDDYIIKHQNKYPDDLINRIRLHIHNSIKYLKHGNNI